MNIQELEQFNLKNAVKFNDELNPNLWDEHEQLKPEVREKLLQIAADFQEYLGVEDIGLKDITISGSNAAFSYNKHSDIDLHLVVDMPDDEVYRELFDAKKYAYNDQHDIKIKGSPVELYVQDANEPHYSQGIYSVLNDEWVDVPKRRSLDVDDSNVESKFNDIVQKITNAIESEDYDTLSNVHKRIKAMRQCGLEKNGEFGVENLTFKMLRNEGWIEKLLNARNDAKDKILSLAEKNKKKQKTIYGFGTPELLQSDVGSSFDGCGETTLPFLNESELPNENSLGQPIANNEESLRNFWNWFRGSKVVDDQGRPLVVYHGTDKRFTKINVKKGAESIFWFTSDKSAIEAGEVGAAGTGVIMELYIKIDHPAGWREYDKLLLDEFKSRGYDGAVLPEKDGTLVGFIFNSDQVKSAKKNKGTYSGNKITDEAINEQNLSELTGVKKYDMFGIHKMAEDVTSEWNGVSPSTQQFFKKNDYYNEDVARIIEESFVQFRIDMAKYIAEKNEKEKTDSLEEGDLVGDAGQQSPFSGGVNSSSTKQKKRCNT
jgi:hypothetical protein